MRAPMAPMWPNIRARAHTHKLYRNNNLRKFQDAKWRCRTTMRSRTYTLAHIQNNWNCSMSLSKMGRFKCARALRCHRTPCVHRYKKRIQPNADRRCGTMLRIHGRLIFLGSVCVCATAAMCATDFTRGGGKGGGEARTHSALHIAAER